MGPSKQQPVFRKALLSAGITLALIVVGLQGAPDLDSEIVIKRLFWPLLRLMGFITLGLAVGQLIEATGWTRWMGLLAGPLFRFGNLGQRCSAAFTTAFISGAAANAMLYDFFQDGKITRRQLFLTNFANQFPAYFLHLPTTVFIVLPLVGWAGALYFGITFIAALVRTLLVLVYGHLYPGSSPRQEEAQSACHAVGGSKQVRKAGFWARVVRRITRIALFVVPIYTFVFVIQALGLFTLARQWVANYVVTTVIPVESLSLVILSFAAEFTSGFAAAGALMDAGVLTTKQTVIALLAGNIVAFPIRALRHQLPRYLGIFTPKMGLQLLLMGQGLRITSLLVVGTAYLVWV